MFTLDSDWNITYLPEGTTPEPREDVKQFSTKAELTAILAGQSLGQLSALWNSFAGVVQFSHLKPVKVFTHSANHSIGRIWDAIQCLRDGIEAQETEQEETVSKPKVRKATRIKMAAGKPGKAKPKAAGKGKRTPKPAGAPGGKKAAVIALISRKGGATVHEIMEKLDWATHTVRGCVSRLNSSNEFHTKTEKTDRGRTYFAA